jgi:transcriptional regulator with XRE-family HTH domain
MLRVGGFRNGSEMAKTLGVTPQAISNYKKKGELSAGFVLRFAGLYNVSVDWLLTGIGNKFRPSSKKSSSVCSIAMVETEVSGSGEKNPGPGATPSAKDRFDLAVLSPDEIIYIGKLIKVFRAPSELGKDEVKAAIDAFLAAAYTPAGPTET